MTSIARGSSPSPILPQTPESEIGSFMIPSHHRSLSTRSIDNVVTGRMSQFHETFDGYGQHHGSEISEGSSNERAAIGGSETIHE